MYKRKTYRRKKRVVRRKRPVRRRALLPRSPGPPAFQFAKLKYSQLRVVNLAAATSDGRNWCLNSLYDPDNSGAGGQPYYFDQYMGLYGKYKVFGCFVQWRLCVTTSTSNLFTPIAAMVPWVTTAGYPDIQTAINRKGVVWRNVMPGQQSYYLKKYYSIADLFGVTKRAVADEDNFSGTVTSNPNNLPILQLMLYNNDASATLTVTSEIQLTYYTKFYSITTPGAS